MRTPYAHTLELLKLAVDKLPPGFPEGRREFFRHLHADFVKQGVKASYDEIQRAIVTLGRDSWPYRRAYEEMYARYGRASEEAHLLNRLDRGLREKYETFIHEGGKIDHVAGIRTEEEMRRPNRFERYFTPEEKFAISQALLDARDEARKEIDELVTVTKAEEYHDLTHAYAAEQHTTAAKIEDLRRLADLSDKWKEEILLRARTLEEGWSVLERAVGPADLDRELEYWKGTLSSFLHA